MGINGGFGGYVAEALAAQGWKIRALMRNPKNLPHQFTSAETIKGDASNIDDVRQAAKNVDLIVYGINPANYDWKSKALDWLNITATVAEEEKLNVVFPGNVYVYNPANGPNFDENTNFDPITEKGKIRQSMERRLLQASQNGAKILILRCGDFIGKNANSTWMKLMFKKTKQGYTMISTGTDQLTHSWAYLPDVGSVVADLASKFSEMDNYNAFNFSGHRLSMSDIAAHLSQTTGKEVKVKKFPWFIVRFITPFSTLMAGIFEMRYLWKHEINLDSVRLNNWLTKKYTPTPLSDVLLESKII